MTGNSSKQTTLLWKPVNSQQRQQIPQNYLLIWLDPNIDESNDDDCQNTLEQLRNTINDINIFNDVNRCVDFLIDIDNDKVFMIVPGTSDEHLVPDIHEIFTLNAIYILCDNKAIHEEWVKQ